MQSLSAYNTLLQQIELLHLHKKEAKYTAVDTMLQTYWHVGRHIVMQEQNCTKKATYSTKLLDTLAIKFTAIFGNGFSRTNISYMRLLYLHFSLHDIQNTKLTWSHYYEILKAETDLEITFYAVQVQKSKWNVRTLKQQMKNKLFHHIGLYELMKLKPKQGLQANFLQIPAG